MVIEVFDPEKNFVLGYIKVSLKDLIRQGKPQTYQTKEYEIYSDNFELNGYIQMLLMTIRSCFMYQATLSTPIIAIIQ